MELHMLRQDHVLRAGQADVGAFRERQRRRRLRNLTLVLGAVAVGLWFRVLTHNPIGLPR